MKDDKENNKSLEKKQFEEKILDSFPEDLLPGYEPSEIDILNSSFAEIIAASGVRDVIDRMVTDPAQKQYTNAFMDGLIEKNSEYFENIRERLKDDSLRRRLFKEIVARSKYVK
jgi:hypothetical protein